MFVIDESGALTALLDPAERSSLVASRQVA
jgi:hypothetical protein